MYPYIFCLLLPSNIPLNGIYHILFIHLSVDGYLGCFHFLYIYNCCEHSCAGFSVDVYFISLGCILWSRIAESLELLYS